ncbi:MAG: hypothetical protein GY940_05570 [bacterium]|nr:hypothetical protein [bacterium]
MTTENQAGALSYKKIFIFWYPLAATWLMMAIENPFVAAIIARLGEPKFNLAAFGVAYSFGLVIEAPVIMIMSASTALVKDNDSFFKLRRFTYSLNFIITVVMVIGLIPPIFYFIAESVIGLPHNVAQLTHIASIILIPWPSAIGYRRFYQGLLIRANLTRRVAYGTIIRLFTMAITALVMFSLGTKGAYVGAASLSMGVIVQAVASRLMAGGTIKKLLQTQNGNETANAGLNNASPTPGESSGKPLTYKYIFKFYYPLALMTTLSLGIHPLVTLFLGKSRMSLESLAVLPVVNALVFLFRSIGLSFTEVGVALLGTDNQNYLRLRNFALVLGISAVSILSVIAFTPLINIWFHQVSGLSLALSDFSRMPVQILAVLPGLSVLISLQRSLLINSKNTTPISWATVIEGTVIIGGLMVSILYFDMIGAIAAATAFVIGRVFANAYLFPHQLRAAPPPK